MSGHPFNFPRLTGQPERSSSEDAEEIPDDEQEQIQVDEGNGEGSDNERIQIPPGYVLAENLLLGTKELFSFMIPFDVYKRALESLNIPFTDEQLLQILNSSGESPDFEVVKEKLLKLLESVAEMKAMREEKLKRGRDREDDDDNNQGGSGIPQKMVK